MRRGCAGRSGAEILRFREQRDQAARLLKRGATDITTNNPRYVAPCGPAPDPRLAHTLPGVRTYPRFFRSHVTSSGQDQPFKGVHFVGGVSEQLPKASATSKTSASNKVKLKDVVVLSVNELKTPTVIDSSGIYATRRL